MRAVEIEGVILTPLKNIHHSKGGIMHAMKKSDPGYAGFGEAYFSKINFGEIKAWTKHTRMTSNLIVPSGKVKFVIYDSKKNGLNNEAFFSVVLSSENYQRLTIPPDLWVGFQGLSEGASIVLNIADMEHDPAESIKGDISEIIYNWSG